MNDPVIIGFDSQWLSVAISKDKVWAWGELETATAEPLLLNPSPTLASIADEFASVSVNRWNAVIRTKNGAIYTMGRYDSTYNVTMSSANRYVPVRVIPPSEGVVAAQAGYYSAYFINGTGATMCPSSRISFAMFIN
jgi:hypothetical protein